jgi:membrane dipeptidase
MERLGMLMDVSHLSMAGTEHVLELASRPVIASHSSARAVLDHHRNLRDDVIRRIAALGGVVGVNLFYGFVDPRMPTIDRVIDHIEHVAAVGGIDHVGIGPDFIHEHAMELYSNYPDFQIEGMTLLGSIEGLEGSRQLPNLTDAMLRRGFTEGDVRKILGENFLRVFGQVMGVPGE